MKVNGGRIWQMVEEYIITLMVPVMKENGLMI